MTKIEQLKQVLPRIENTVKGLRKESAKSLCGPCPKCKGDDRFVYKLEQDRFWCRRCNEKGGDVIEFHAWMEGTDVKGLMKKYLPEVPLKTKPPNSHKMPLEPFEHFELGFPIEKYPYKTAKDEIVRYNCRFEPKAFRQCDATGLIWLVKNLKPNVPYNLKDVTEANMIFIVEGEKDVHSLARLNLVGTCNVGGAGNWHEDLNQYFKGKKVYLIPDNDVPGRKHAEKVYQNLKDIADSIFLIELQEQPEGGDFTDWMTEFDDLDEAGERFAILIDGAKPYDPKKDPAVISCLTSFTACDLMDMELPDPKWAVPGLIPEGLGILGGKPKKGKSVLVTNLSVNITTGSPALGEIDIEKGAVLYLALEDSTRRLKTRLHSMLQGRPAPKQLHFETEWPRIDQGGLDKLDKRIQEIPDLRLVIIDTLKKIRPIQKDRNTNPYDIDYENIAAIKKLADKHCIAILLVHHLRKTQSEDIMDDFSGTFGLTGAADYLLAFDRKSARADAVLHIVGRDVDAEEYALKYHPDIWTWELIGKAKDVKGTETRQAIYDVLMESDSPLTPKEIEKRTGLKYRTVNKGLKILLDNGSLSKTEYGKYRIPAYL